MNCKGQPASFIVACGNTSVSCADMLFLFCCQPQKPESRRDNILVIASVLTQPPYNPHFLKLQARSHLFQALSFPATYQLLSLHWDDRQIPIPGFTLKPCLPWPDHSSGKSGVSRRLREPENHHKKAQSCTGHTAWDLKAESCFGISQYDGQASICWWVQTWQSPPQEQDLKVRSHTTHIPW